MDANPQNLSQFGLESATRLHEAGFASNRASATARTVYPGVTEDVCIPILERESGLTAGSGFKVGYSPERINPGDRFHRLENITKIVSGMDDDALDLIARVYDIVIRAGTHRVSSIKAAEAIKVAENSQRDIILRSL